VHGGESPKVLAPVQAPNKKKGIKGVELAAGGALYWPSTLTKQKKRRPLDPCYKGRGRQEGKFPGSTTLRVGDSQPKEQREKDTGGGNRKKRVRPKAHADAIAPKAKSTPGG